MSTQKPLRLAIISLIIAIVTLLRSQAILQSARNVDLLTFFIGGVATGVALSQFIFFLRSRGAQD